MLSLTALAGLPEVERGADLGGLIVRALAAAGIALAAGDALVIAHKVVSKAEGRVRRLAEVTPGPRARALAAEHGKDARHVQVILDESAEVLRADRGRLVCVTHHGFVCANAGVDASNAARPGELVLLPADPDRSAAGIRSRLRVLTGMAPAVVITDSFGRAWRHGQVDIAIGCAGLAPLEDWRGRRDAAGRELHATRIAVADELAAAADLARAKDGAQPVIHARGDSVRRHAVGDDGPGARAVIRDAADDLFR